MSPAPALPARRLVHPSGPGGRSAAARSPFVLLIVALLAGGLISLLLLNAAVNQDSFTLSKLQKQTDQLTDEQQALQQEVDEYSAPGALDKRARELGMVPGGTPAFLAPNGTLRGDPAEVTASVTPQRAAPAADSTSFLSPTPRRAAAAPSPSAGTTAQEGR